MESFAYYRLPFCNRYTLLRQSCGRPRALSSAAELGRQSGFVMAPFAVSTDCPMLLLMPDEVEEHPVPLLETVLQTPIPITITTDRAGYSADFVRFHRSICNGTFSKIVLARSAEVVANEVVGAEALFFRACCLYPQLFVSLFSAPACGTWLMATPEILLDGNRSDWHTMALAGTMKWRGEVCGEALWSDKNIQEQRYVSTYLAHCLGRFGAGITETEPRTVRAGQLVHLRSDFRFTLPDGRKIGDLINALHPTPAICGLPKDEAYRFILANEHISRRYYSGFAGPFDPDGTTHLYVSLRCMQIFDNYYRLYAGGGLLSDSTEQQEWDETEAKMETALEVFKFMS